jgi:methionyl-tRNA synthetase
MHAIAHGIYEDVVRRHKRREGSYVMTIDGSDELPKSRDRAG